MITFPQFFSNDYGNLIFKMYIYSEEGEVF